MTNERLLDILDAYGAQTAHWPAAERDAAIAALEAADADTLARFDEARALDALLALDLETRGPSDLLSARILRAAPKPALARRAAPLVALAACAVIGIAIGFNASTLQPSTDLEEAAFAQAFDDMGPSVEGFGGG